MSTESDQAEIVTDCMSLRDAAVINLATGGTAIYTCAWAPLVSPEELQLSFGRRTTLQIGGSSIAGRWASL